MLKVPARIQKLRTVGVRSDFWVIVLSSGTIGAKLSFNVRCKKWCSEGSITIRKSLRGELESSINDACLVLSDIDRPA